MQGANLIYMTETFFSPLPIFNSDNTTPKYFLFQSHLETVISTVEDKPTTFDVLEYVYR